MNKGKRKNFFIVGLSIVLVILIFFLLTIKSNKLPSYNSQKSVGKQAEYTVTGIEAGAGIMSETQRAIKKYGLNQAGNSWQLQTSSTAVMLSQLGKAMGNHQAIVITGWLPHWMFEKYNIKFLKDPKHVYGTSEHFSTLTKKGFKNDNTGAYQFLKNFSVSMNQIMPIVGKMHEGESTSKAASRFVKEHPKQVSQWMNRVPNGNNQKISLAHVSLSYETFVTKMVANLLKARGYKVSMRTLDPGIMWTSLATKSVDATVTGELPITHGSYYRKYKEDVDLVRTSLKGTKLGLAVPKYMKNVKSINDLKK